MNWIFVGVADGEWCGTGSRFWRTDANEMCFLYGEIQMNCALDGLIDELLGA